MTMYHTVNFLRIPNDSDISMPVVLRRVRYCYQSKYITDVLNYPVLIYSGMLLGTVPVQYSCLCKDLIAETICG